MPRPHPSRATAAVACVALALLLGPVPSGAESKAELTYLVDSPTAGLLQKGTYGFHLRLFSEGGIAGQLSAGALSRLTISVAYGGERIIGDSEVDWYPRMEAGVRYRFVEESTTWPALVVGYDTHGHGEHSNGRYRYKSKGLYCALSKNYTSTLGQFGVHAGLNRSGEDSDGDSDLSGWLGVDKQINQDLVLVAEYDLALNDNASASWGTGEGYLNAGLCMHPAPSLAVSVYAKNMLRSGPDRPRITRELAVQYSEEF